MFYGTPITDPDRLAALPGPVVGVFGAEDSSIPLGGVEAFERALEAAGVPHDIRVYDGVGHAFVGGMDEILAGGAAGEAWEAFRAWTAEVTGTAE